MAPYCPEATLLYLEHRTLRTPPLSFPAMLPPLRTLHICSGHIGLSHGPLKRQHVPDLESVPLCFSSLVSSYTTHSLLLPGKLLLPPSTKLAFLNALSYSTHWSLLAIIPVFNNRFISLSSPHLTEVHRDPAVSFCTLRTVCSQVGTRENLLTSRLNGHREKRDGPSTPPAGLTHTRQLERKEKMAKWKAEVIPDKVNSLFNMPGCARCHAMHWGQCMCATLPGPRAQLTIH